MFIFRYVLLVLFCFWIPLLSAEKLPAEFELNNRQVSLLQPQVFYTGGKILLFGNVPFQGLALYSVDPDNGNKELIRMLPDNSYVSSSAGEIVAIRDSSTPRLFFILSTTQYGRELWFSDGTTDGTNITKDLSAGSENTIFSSLIQVGDNIVFSAGINFDFELGFSDGTADGTGVHSLSTSNSSKSCFFSCVQ
jgi:ELWxxDGT repeat protein